MESGRKLGPSRGSRNGVRRDDWNGDWRVYARAGGAGDIRATRALCSTERGKIEGGRAGTVKMESKRGREITSSGIVRRSEGCEHLISHSNSAAQSDPLLLKRHTKRSCSRSIFSNEKSSRWPARPRILAASSSPSAESSVLEGPTTILGEHLCAAKPRIRTVESYCTVLCIVSRDALLQFCKKRVRRASLPFALSASVSEHRRVQRVSDFEFGKLSRSLSREASKYVLFLDSRLFENRERERERGRGFIVVNQGVAN